MPIQTACFVLIFKTFYPTQYIYYCNNYVNMQYKYKYV